MSKPVTKNKCPQIQEDDCSSREIQLPLGAGALHWEPAASHAELPHWPIATLSHQKMIHLLTSELLYVFSYHEIFYNMDIIRQPIFVLKGIFSTFLYRWES